MRLWGPVEQLQKPRGEGRGREGGLWEMRSERKRVREGVV